MKQLFRLLKILILSRFQAPIGALEESAVHFRVWPNDLDPFLHMNNGVYLTLLDLGRISMMVRTGMMKVARQRGYHPVVASEAIKFRSSLTPFQKFSIETKMVGWDERYFFISQRFVVKGKVAAIAVIKGCLLGKKGERVAPQEIFRLMGYPQPSPPLPPAATKLLQVDEELR